MRNVFRMLRFASGVLIPALVSSAAAVELRVASFNIGAHFNETYFDYSLGDPGTVDFESVRKVLARINADVVALQEIHSVDLQGAPDDLDSLAAALGYGHVFVPPHASAFDSSLKVVVLSRFPFLTTSQVESPAGAKELTRLHPVVKVDVPGTTNDPVIYALHLKADTLSADRFRRAVEMKRLVGHLNASGVTGDDNFIILGDFNPSAVNTTFSALPTGLPGTYALGSDVAFPVTYSTNPLAYFSTVMPARLDPRHLNGSVGTYGTTGTSGPTLDIMLVSPAIAGRPHAQEIYNSTLDVSNASGLAKAGAPLADGTSALASDHYAVFADLEMDADFPNLDLVLSAISVREGAASGTVTATVHLPAARSAAVTVSLASGDASVAVAPATQVIAAGQLSCVFQLAAPRTFLFEGNREVTLSASASGYDPDAAVLEVEEADGPYVFTMVGQTLVEDFDGFQGGANPGAWTVAGGSGWLGTDDGSSAAPGWRSYGVGSERAVGWLGSGAVESVAAEFVNATGTTLNTLRVALAAEQWRAAFEGGAAGIEMEVVVGAQTIPLPGLDFSADRSLSTGAVSGGSPASLTALATGLGVPAGSAFSLRAKFHSGASAGAAPAEVFVNEIHYDNTGTDAEEFVELVVGPGFTRSPADVSLVVYNGSNGQVVSTHLLDTFTAGALTASGHRVYHKLIPGLQNDSEGLAVVVGGVVGQFISYEGPFTATQGPAAGMTTVNVGVTQSGSDPVGMAAIGLQGAGAVAGDFTWVKFTGSAHSPGAPNLSQTFALPVPPPQGVAIDNLSITFVADHDADGIADEVDPDDDNDGMTDLRELALGSDPRDAGARFTAQLTRATTAPHGAVLSFPGRQGISYTVESSTDLVEWTQVSTHAGGGVVIEAPVPESGPRRFYRVRVPAVP